MNVPKKVFCKENVAPFLQALLSLAPPSPPRTCYTFFHKPFIFSASRQQDSASIRSTVAIPQHWKCPVPFYFEILFSKEEGSLVKPSGPFGLLCSSNIEKPCTVHNFPYFRLLKELKVLFKCVTLKLHSARTDRPTKQGRLRRGFQKASNLTCH